MSNQERLVSSEFGESNFGQRLDYSRPVYRDVGFAIFYVVHIVVVIGLTIYFWASISGDLDVSPIDSTPSPTSSYSYPTPSPVSFSSDIDFANFNATGLVVGFLCAAVLGVVMGVCWLQILKTFAGVIIKGMLITNIAIWVIVALVGVIYMNKLGPGLIVIGAILALVSALKAWCVWSRIPFASALLGISCQIITKYQGTVIVGFLVVVAHLFWSILWVAMMVGYLLNCAYYKDEDGYSSPAEPQGWVIFLMLISFYWGIQVNQNTSHTTTCGVAATWYFSPLIDHKPTPAALKRTLTTSFGSVCLGSLIVAFLQATRAMLRNSKSGRSPLLCFAICLLWCIERLIRYFNTYAFAQVAIYGTTFVQSAKATWNLFMTRGILAIINDNLVGMAIGLGALVGGVVAAGAHFAICFSVYGPSYNLISGITAIYALYLGLGFCALVLKVVPSCVVALFVCYSEDPASMNQNRPEEYQRVINAKPEWEQVYITHGGVQRQAAGPVMQTTPAQPVVIVQQQQQPMMVPAGQAVVSYVPPTDGQQPQTAPYNNGV